MLIDRPTITETSYISNAVIDSGGTDPSNPDQGELFFRTDLAALRVFNGSAWVSIPNFDPSGDIDLGAGDITTTGDITAGGFFGDATNLTGTATALNIGGNAATSTVLQTPRTIAVSGGATGTATSFDGSANIAIPITALDASSLSTGTVPVARLTGTYSIDVAGNAATATALQTARTIGVSGITGTAQSFDGTANITIPISAVTTTLLTGTIAPANLSGSYNIDISGSAATLAPGATINGVTFDGSGPITVTADAGTLTGTTLNATVVSSSLTSVGTLGGLSVSGAANFTNTVTLAADPTAALHAATKQYVDNLIANGVSWKQAARVATTADITLSGLQTIDGVAVAVADRVLVRAQTNAAENGIYEAATGAWSRTADANTGVKLASASVFVQQGTTYQDVAWVQTADNITLGTTPLAWVQFSTAGGGVAGNGITISGTTISVNPAPRLTFTGVQLDLTNTGVTPSTYGSASSVPALTVDAYGRITTGASAISITSANTVSTVVSRDGSGNFSAGTITGSLTGSATQLGGIAAASHMAFRGSVTVANINTATSNGFYDEGNSGYSKAVLVFNPGGSAGTMQYRHTYGGGPGEMFEFRNRTDNITWSAWKAVLHSSNYNSYSPTLTGGGASGTWGINITGNSATVGGFTPTATAAVGNRVVVANASGYIFNNYFNSTDNSVASGVSAVMVKAGDNYYRSGTAASIAEFLASTALQTTSLSVANGGAGQIRIQTGGGSNTGYIEFFRPGGSTREGYIGYTTVGGSMNYVSETAGAHSFSGSITASGDITAFSDARLKTNIEVIPNAIEKVEALRGVTFERIDSGERGTGVIAQEVQAVLAEAVRTQEDGTLSVAYGNLVGLLIEAVKDLNTEVKALKAELAKVAR